jgi:hypothetical protein
VKCFKSIVAILMLVLMVPLARACAVISSATVARGECCKQKADTCCDGPSHACCAMQAPADTSLLPTQDVPLLLTTARTVPVVHTNRFDNPNARCAAILLPAKHLPPGLMIAATTVLRI